MCTWPAVGPRMRSLSEVAAGEPAGLEQGRFSLWPLPELHTVLAPTDLRHGGEVPTQPSAEEEAYERGEADGNAASEAKYAAEVERVVHTLTSCCEALQAMRANCVEEMQKQVFVLAMAVAREVIQRQVETDPGIVHALVRRALDEVSWETRIDVRLHPDDLAAVQHHSGQGDGERMPMALAWIADNTIERGGCVVETPQRIVDARIETVLAALHRRLTHE